MFEFYQVGGWQCHFKNWNELKASGGGYFQDDISGSIHLVQGILPSGATYILAPKSPKFQPYRRKLPYRSCDYASLSPVQFLSLRDLEVALKPLNEFRKWSEKEDNSAANKRYNGQNGGGRATKSLVITGNLLMKKNASFEEESLRRQMHAGHQRSAFEHSRVLFQFVHGELNDHDVQVFSVGRHPEPLKSRPQIVFYHATRTPVLERNRVAHRDSDALIFRDYGWGILDTKSFNLEQCTSLPVEGVLSNDDPQEAFHDKLVEPRPVEDVTKSVRSFFTSILSKNDSQPPRDTVIITCDAREQLRGIQECMVDVDDWEVGLCSLFDADASVLGEEKNRYNDRSRSRSPGPSRKASRDPRKSPQRKQPSVRSSRRTPSPTRQGNARERRRRCSVHVVDVMDLWAVLPVTLFERDGLSELRKLALKLGIDCDLHAWSAGRDIELLHKIWASLCGSAPIDIRGAEIAQSLDSAKLLSKDRSRSVSDAQKPDFAEDENMEKSGKSVLKYAFGAGAVQDATPRAETPDYDPYGDFADGVDPYDDD